MNTWLATESSSFWWDANWSLGHIPRPNEEVVFDGDETQTDCQAFGPANPETWYPGVDTSFAKVRLIDGYAGSVELNDDVVIHDLELTSGSIDNPMGGCDITIKDEFLWTGGTLNDTEYLNNLKLDPGSEATIAPGEENTLVTGSTLLLADATNISSNGAVATFTAGTVCFMNLANLIVNNLCEARIDVSTAKIEFSVGGFSTGMSGIYINEGGKGTVSGGTGNEIRTWYSNNLPVSVNGGTLEVQAYTVADVSGRVGGLEQNSSVHLDGGQITLVNRSRLKVEHGLNAYSGKVVTKFNANVAFFGGGGFLTSWAIIEGNFNNYGADIYIYYGESTRVLSEGNIHFGELEVIGNIYWYGGSYRPVVYGPGGNASYADRWYCSGTFTIEGYAAIEPGSVSAAGVLNVAPEQGGTHWLIIAAGTLSVHSGCPQLANTTWCEIQPLSVNPTELFLRTLY